MLKRMWIFVSLVFFAANVSGCAAILVGTAGGVGTAVWLGGKMSEEVDASYEKSFEATKTALTSLDMKITKETKKETVAQIMSEYTDGATVWIDLRPTGDKRTQIDVRVGATGNKDASRKILDTIKKKL